MKECIACGMPMEKAEDFAGGDVLKDFCAYCANDDGTMKTYDEVLGGVTSFIVTTQGLDENAARETAKSMMSKLPAWSGQK